MSAEDINRPSPGSSGELLTARKNLQAGKFVFPYNPFLIILLALSKVLIITDYHNAHLDSSVIFGLETQILYCNPSLKIIIEGWEIEKQAADMSTSAACQTTTLFQGQPDWLISRIKLHETRLL
jgi:hypothetical protein